MNDLITIFSFYGFNECNNSEVNFAKINEGEYLVFRTYAKGKITDLLLEKYHKGQSPCNSKPVSDKVLKQGFNPKENIEIIKEYINK